MAKNAEASDAASGQRIFLIDPDVVSRSALYYMIADANETFELDSIEDLADIGARLAPDILIVSALLVAKHGKTLIKEWRTAWPQAGVLVICEDSDTDCVMAAKTAGADDTLQRPVRRDVVLRKMARWAEPSPGTLEPKRLLQHKDNSLPVRL